MRVTKSKLPFVKTRKYPWGWILSSLMVGVLLGIAGVWGVGQVSGRYAYLPALLGDPQRQFEYGMSLYRQERYGEALIWLTKAADANHSNAMLQIGLMFANMDVGLKPGLDAALPWAIESAKLGNPYAMVMAAAWYETLKDKYPDGERKALYWYGQAAFRGMEPALERLISIYAKGELGERASPELEQFWKDKLKELAP